MKYLEETINDLFKLQAAATGEYIRSARASAEQDFTMSLKQKGER